MDSQQFLRKTSDRSHYLRHSFSRLSPAATLVSSVAKVISSLADGVDDFRQVRQLMQLSSAATVVSSTAVVISSLAGGGGDFKASAVTNDFVGMPAVRALLRSGVFVDTRCHFCVLNRAVAPPLSRPST